MSIWKRGDIVEVDGLLAVVVGAEDDPDTPEEHVVVWFGEPRTNQKSEGGPGGQRPEIWTVPVDFVTKAAPPVWRH